MKKILLLLFFVATFSYAQIEQTFAIIKPDAVQAKHSGKIIDMIEQNDFEILIIQKGELTKELAENLYAHHKSEPFFDELIAYVCSGPILIMVLQKENAIQDWRTLTGGGYEPAKAPMGTIRRMYGTSISHNAIHGSESKEAAVRELKLFFSPDSNKTEHAA